MTNSQTRRRSTRSDVNKLTLSDRPVHEWYRFVLSYPPHLVQDYLKRFDVTSSQRVLDPFCGTGTTVVECKKLGIPSVGLEANAMAHFASQVKIDWDVDPDGLLNHSHRVAAMALAEYESAGIVDALPFFSLPVELPAVAEFRELGQEQSSLILENSISPLPLHKTLVLLKYLEANSDQRYERHERLALARAVVNSISNLHFGPEVGVGALKEDAPVVEPWLAAIHSMSADLRDVRERAATPAFVHLADARNIAQVLEPGSIDVVITSPPYPNEKDYTRTTRLESVLLGFLKTKKELQALKRNLMRSNTRNVYKGDDDDKFVTGHAEVQELVQRIELLRIAMKKTSGFEKLYGRVTKLYFGGMARHLTELQTVLRPGAHLAYVVGDQASYLQVMIRTGLLLADIAEHLGYETLGIDLFRTRLATATREQIREEVVVLRWPGEKKSYSLGVPAVPRPNLYAQIIERIFTEHYTQGASEVRFEREDIERVAARLGIRLPKNLGDVVYSFRYRTTLPDAVHSLAPEGTEWIIRPVGRAQYAFIARPPIQINPNPLLSKTKVPDATPGIITMYAQTDEQGLLARVRYNRLIDIFTGVTCYSLQNHLRTTVPEMGQVETDELYVGVDRRGAHYIFPVQAKGGTDRLGIVQIEQDFALCADKFSGLICRPIAVQFMSDGAIALFSFEDNNGDITISSEKHYQLVPPDQLSSAELTQYRQRHDEGVQ